MPVVVVSFAARGRPQVLLRVSLKGHLAARSTEVMGLPCVLGPGRSRFRAHHTLLRYTNIATSQPVRTRNNRAVPNLIVAVRRLIKIPSCSEVVPK